MIAAAAAAALAPKPCLSASRSAPSPEASSSTSSAACEASTWTASSPATSAPLCLRGSHHICRPLHPRRFRWRQHPHRYHHHAQVSAHSDCFYLLTLEAGAARHGSLAKTWLTPLDDCTLTRTASACSRCGHQRPEIAACPLVACMSGSCGWAPNGSRFCPRC
ncbi:hypothetical protein K437DRAFT_71187 [Tilletiaria anomala UBC 951]|uniref:Uncharacterized protein n=1 Tax=Tilletiaria anomala (strain ATCC 24038 / CBS 436.72 / UBC 951) TaxID=1037660 RepID=A0A066WLG0_TILAU|nr:uncharacterized protein K437DRAFT_71187 [Tilletiaria anomala UBC 951]KDN53423.1 hypothetical protein K437DRAFT_71187 [Tilletiaria anomala UBC 951]